MAKTVARLFDKYEAASIAVQKLEASGIPDNDISLVAKNADGRVKRDVGNEAAPGAEIGASVGAVAGGGAGVLAGLGMLAIPGIGPVVAAGWLVALAAGAASGAAAGGLIGGLVGSGISKEHAEIYAEGVRRGSTLVTVRGDDETLRHAEAILNSGAVDPSVRRAEYMSAGWTGHAPNQPV